MIRSILVPLDGFAFGEHALPIALSLARRANASVRLLHVLQPFVEVVPELAAYQGPMETEYRQEKLKYLEGVARRLREVTTVPITADLMEGEVVPTIHEAVEKSDLVVMTTHGRGPLARFWLGSVADQLVRELTVPFLLMHPGKEPPDFHKEPAFHSILVPLDGTPLSEQIVPAALDMAQLMKAELVLLRVLRTELPPDFGYQYHGGYVPAQAREMVTQLEVMQQRQKREAEAYLKSIADRAWAVNVTATTKVILDETPVAAILHETTTGVDAVALATHGYGGMKRLWLGSVADKIIRGSAIPVLVQHPQT